MNMATNLSQRATLYVFAITLVFLLAQAIWWFIFMGQLAQEKITLSEQLGASRELITNISNEENKRHRMIIFEGSFFLLSLVGGLALVYRSLIQERRLRKQQENFMMAVTHELKTPLASMSVYLDGLKSPEIPEHVKQSLVPKIKGDVYRLQKQIENVLEAARTPQLADRREFKLLNFSEVVSERINAIRKFKFETDYKFYAEIESNAMLIGDRRSLGKGIDAILENAIIHNQGRAIEIIVLLRTVDNHIILEIIDNGLGIPQNELGRVFEQFYRVGSELTRSSQGSGLGLFICHEIVKAHGGTIRAVSDGVSPGVKFIMRFKKRKS